ncbi:N-acetylmuramoyl-L-alanine amidase [Streptomyces wuyuanensis]|uniref:N-acetylmuramoyl-L-alanine amidase n=1 Tax=Streptomyces wuyuanensis TaxID=1196353 RepID=UPI00343346F1
MATPLTADQLIRALRDEGVRVQEHSGWRTNNRNHKGPWGPVRGVMIHHTVTSGTANSVQLCYDGHSTLPGPLCHGVIDKQGVVHLVGNGRANHAGLGDDDVLNAVTAEALNIPVDDEANTDGNRYFYGFECINLGDGKDPWPAAQLEAIERVSAAICRAHGWSQRSVIGHLEWQPGKIDPRGFTMDSMRARIKSRLAVVAAPAPSQPVPTKPAPTPVPTAPLPAGEDGDMPQLLNETNSIDVAVGRDWLGLAFNDAVLHTGPRRHTTLVHLLFEDQVPDGTLIEGRFYLTDTQGKNPSAYLPVSHQGGGGHQFLLTGQIPDARHLRFEVRATTPDGTPVKLLHRVTSGLYWAA